MSRSEVVVIPGSGAATNRYSGYSWTTLFFGPFPALFRGDLVGAAIGMIVGILTLGLGWIIWAALYNDSHAKRLAERGYRPASIGVTGSLGPTSSDGNVESVLAFDSSGWTDEGSVQIGQQLDQRGIQHQWDGQDLVVDPKHEALLDQLISDISPQRSRELVDDVEVAYSTASWSPILFKKIQEAIGAACIPHYFEDGEMFVAKVDEPSVDELVEALLSQAPGASDASASAVVEESSDPDEAAAE